MKQEEFCRCRPGMTVWFTGLPSAGKSTIAHELAARMLTDGRRVAVLDGDELGKSLAAGLGFGREDRHTNVQRIGMLSEVLARNGIVVLVPVIAPYAVSREAVRKRHQEAGVAYVEVHVAAPVEVCRKRDVKGLYMQQTRGEMSGLSGVDAPYEVPGFPDLRIPSHTQSIPESVNDVWHLLATRELV
ncbi:adenylyl-sulfate kinase [Streptomyces sp. NPDC020298]|uniref:adenylyl-sulfate kinase n=1 Tax=unclassified Streptomyces TaxID=2593676 RepID=UPI003403F966